MATRFDMGVYLIDLSALSDPALVTPTIASEFGVRELPGVDLVRAIAAELAGGDALVVVDNCEQVLDSAAAAVDAMLSTAPGARVLATSREPLAVSGEQLWRIAPLGVPGPGDNPEVIRRAVRFACSRTGLSWRDRDSLSAPIRLGQWQTSAKLEGLPLAIELTAARVSAMSPSTMAARLENDWPALVAARRATGRHRSLEAAIDWSYQLLDTREQQVLRELSVFASGFSVEGN